MSASPPVSCRTARPAPATPGHRGLTAPMAAANLRRLGLYRVGVGGGIAHNASGAKPAGPKQPGIRPNLTRSLKDKS